MGRKSNLNTPTKKVSYITIHNHKKSVWVASLRNGNTDDGTLVLQQSKACRFVRINGSGICNFVKAKAIYFYLIQVWSSFESNKANLHLQQYLILITFNCKLNCWNILLLFPGQWSPCNPEGKKQYDRDFLYDLAKDPMSLVKPTNLPQMDIIKVSLIKYKFYKRKQVSMLYHS